GAAALIYEVTWTRLLTLNMGHTVAAVSTVLAAFMGGLAAGAWLAGRRPPPRRRSLHTYAALEIAVALIAIALPFALRAFQPALRDAVLAVTPEPPRGPTRDAAGSRRLLPAIRPRPALACAAAGLSGFGGLVYEVAFTRLLAAVIGPTTYAFATMAASFICGIALG